MNERRRRQKLTRAEATRVAEAQVWIADYCAKKEAYIEGDGREATNRQNARKLRGVDRLVSVAREKPRARYPGHRSMKDVLYDSGHDLERGDCDPDSAKRLVRTGRSLR